MDRTRLSPFPGTPSRTDRIQPSQPHIGPLDRNTGLRKRRSTPTSRSRESQTRESFLPQLTIRDPSQEFMIGSRNETGILVEQSRFGLRVLRVAESPRRYRLSSLSSSAIQFTISSPRRVRSRTFSETTLVIAGHESAINKARQSVNSSIYLVALRRKVKKLHEANTTFGRHWPIFRQSKSS